MTPFIELMDIIEKAKAFGYDNLSNGVRLYGHVPHVAAEAWLHTVYAPLGDAQISELESVTGKNFPDIFKQFLSMTNGLNLFSGSLSIDGLRQNNERFGDASRQPFSIETPNVYEKPVGTPDTHLSIGGYKYDGSRLVIDTETLKVFRFPQTEAQPVLNEWPSFWDMLLSEAKRLSLQFDNEGKRINPKEPTIPSTLNA
ncbi:SMI1/KNR4 family protein [Chitinimonas sp. BJB300]|uniref:SMI1/KNR4 family protein n=1 Tax=Chitinimonas sp. BJB300 TaxID=1559339 RepID=UPI000C113C45|nr:SMI1/KNR4 family protein [Chitinimonas sp. BJB300]PHV12233.1 SMI1/KNR4 family protein [Chitinimonas sp. BJB300]TSJ85208.1 SMI1/KNR4 family protein [Chitinimonas sp. BJB300]